ncbi:ABC transporter ATP-binding protein/permease [Saccharothrix sp. Mg75]|uniref:ABC transporter ATP-binding protein/permease n=1 Tax=Saccharothrix sp. Mg75 TaxID=3445357 RepID=UPI003EEA2C49
MTSEARRGARVPWGLVVPLGLVLLVAVLGPFLAPHAPDESVSFPFAPSAPGHPLGTDYLGADVLSRLLHGGRTLVLVALAVLVVTYSVATAAGMLAAHRGGWVDHTVMRTADVLMGLPAIVLLTVIVTGVGRGTGGAAVAITVVLLPDIVRVVRTATAGALSRDYVEVAAARGEPGRSVLVREVLPNLGPVLAADLGVRFVAAVYAVATASFLGLGVQPPTADWALMIFENRGGLALQPLAVLAPVAALVVLLSLSSALADRLAVDRSPRRAPRRARVVRAVADDPRPAVAAEVVGLRIAVAGTDRTVVDGVDLAVRPGEVLGLVGASGSGKTTIALALLGHLRPGLVHVGGVTRVAGHDLGARSGRALRLLRARHAAYVAQDPRTALPSHLRVRAQLAEVLRARGVARAEVDALSRAALRRANLPDDDEFLDRRPHQMSGGQLQRLALAIALTHRPAVVVLDEPTSALDADNADRLLAEFVELCRVSGAAAVLVSHDLPALATAADRLAVVDGGRVVEVGPAERVLTAPTHPGTRQLVVAADTPVRREPPEDAPDLLVVSGVTVRRRGVGVVLDRASLRAPAGGGVCLVGPSGCGKTTLLRVVAGLMAPAEGSVLLDGVPLAPLVAGRDAEQLRRVQLVPQNPYDSLNPRHTVRRIVARPLEQFDLCGDDEEVTDEVVGLLRRVGLTERHADSLPAALSGGERQRVAIARALAADPDVLLCDEVTSALDRAVAASVVDLLSELREERGLTLLVVTHDPAVVRRVGGEVHEMVDGRPVPRPRPAMA